MQCEEQIYPEPLDNADRKNEKQLLPVYYYYAVMKYNSSTCDIDKKNFETIDGGAGSSVSRTSILFLYYFTLNCEKNQKLKKSF